MQNTIDKSMPIPLYYQLKQLIINSINDSTFKENELIPTEFELIDKYQLSRTTVRQALNELVTEGFLYRKKGVGTFVANKTLRELQEKKKEEYPLYQIPNMIRKQGYVSSTKFLHVDSMKATEEIAEYLQIPLGTEVWVMDRLRYADDMPVSFSRSHFRKTLIEEFDKDAERASQNFYRYLDQKGYPVEIVKEYLEPGIIDKKTAEIMRMTNKRIIMIIKDLGLLKDGTPIEYSISNLDVKVIKIEASIARTPTQKR